METPSPSVPPQPAVLVEDRLLAESAADGRQCGECTACCTVLAVAELHKPARWACDYVDCTGCAVYQIRPPTCRQFHCLWLRGAIAGGEEFRPDRLGVLFDAFRRTAGGPLLLFAVEVLPGAFDDEYVRDMLAAIARNRELHLSRRDGTWGTIGGPGDGCFDPPAPSP
jgi:hypothetical protein